MVRLLIFVTIFSLLGQLYYKGGIWKILKEHSNSTIKQIHSLYSFSNILSLIIGRAILCWCLGSLGHTLTSVRTITYQNRMIGGRCGCWASRAETVKLSKISLARYLRKLPEVLPFHPYKLVQSL